MPNNAREGVLDTTAAPSTSTPPSIPTGAAVPLPSTPASELPTDAILRSIALGAVAGMRSMTPLALLAAAAQSPDAPVARALAGMGVMRRLRSRASLAALGCAAAGELVADKLPFVPARIRFGPLAGRAVIGAVAGAAASSASGGSAVRGARRGAAAAVLAAYVGYFARTRLSRRSPIPGPVWGLAEDTLAIGLGTLALLPSLSHSVRDLFSNGTSNRSKGL